MPTGLTRDAGWQIGVSRTLPLPVGTVWDFLAGERGAALWLGTADPLPTERGAPYRTADGIAGEVRGYRVGDRIRVTHGDTTIQVALAPAGADRTAVTFHEERLPDAAARERRRAHWQRVMDEVAAELLPG
ncbi:activator of HSP90 ATPase 1 family protein [Streptomyces solincola]|uniref:Activator of HSP90 ATPase 1 family protein n=1 Tax=Streptomyces solincola TaxID=2100817 RepID=A0A2S9Q2Y8_9ACTN|nr:activator of HSP90 ATPase 1 family protein [Streptomyces solincola]PRH81026.1 activator of HSP90 ATPase 1 family protein [Streptomyces solincola]